ncbi:hypothetical protein K488DRAFT_9155, partial [Vararia minispora EC-137]
FIDHLIAVINVCELGIQGAAATPKWHGADDWRFKSILRSLDAIMRRAYTAEAQLEAFRKSD